MLEDGALERVVHAKNLAVWVIQSPQQKILPATVVRGHDYPVATRGACQMLVAVYPLDVVEVATAFGTSQAYRVHHDLSKGRVGTLDDALNLLLALLGEGVANIVVNHFVAVAQCA